MEELLWNKMDQMLETFTSMETNISPFHTELNNVKEDKYWKNKWKVKLRIHTELINAKLKITDSKVENLEASIKLMSEKF